MGCLVGQVITLVSYNLILGFRLTLEVTRLIVSLSKLGSLWTIYKDVVPQ